MGRWRKTRSMRWPRVTVWTTNKWREWMEHKGSVLSITVGEGVAVDPLLEVDNEKHTWQSQQNQMYKLKTFASNNMKENKGRNNAPNILLYLTSNVKEGSKHEECKLQIRSGQRNSVKSFQYISLA